ncbi:alpha/beta hydrolase [Bradyrhizobium sp. dw_78]|uniref:alpha/beta hydrolase n=1 Tax=Bradyrhizobium sp. dw_78 TaxID=2719793 RepID=UPI0023EF3561|nr:alpha/beta hydrolase [Bradyrhizobium sp. dw_78]
MRTELISIETDTAPLDGALYQPDNQPVRGAVLLFHGNVMNFYSGMLRFLPPALTSLGFVCLAFNRRSHDILATYDSRAAVGGAFQLVARDIEDNRIAAAWLAQRGHPNPIVIGHSNGGMLATQHVCDHPETPALVLLSAHRGGKIDEALRAGTRGNGMMTEDGHLAFKAEALRLVNEGRGNTLMVMPGWWHVITAETYLDRISNMPDVIANASRITCPVLYVRGDEEVPSQYPAEEFKAAAAGPCDIRIIPDCDHYYRGRSDAVTAVVTKWLQKLP